MLFSLLNDFLIETSFLPKSISLSLALVNNWTFFDKFIEFSFGKRNLDKLTQFSYWTMVLELFLQTNLQMVFERKNIRTK